MPETPNSTFAALRNWFHTHRGILESAVKDRLPEWEADLKRLDELEQAVGQELPVCFLGQSSASSRLRIGVGDPRPRRDNSPHKEASHGQEVYRAALR